MKREIEAQVDEEIALKLHSWLVTELATKSSLVVNSMIFLLAVCGLNLTFYSTFGTS